MSRSWTDPAPTCRKCPRLVKFRRDNQKTYPDFHNAPVMTWGAVDAPLLIVGLAPGLKGANRTGRPFTGDASGDLLFDCLTRAGLAKERAAQIILNGCAITNAVACLPPQNRPTGAEASNCRPFLSAKLKSPRTVLALGKLAHDSVLRALGVKIIDHPFAHAAISEIDAITLVSSYHPSRYNVSTKRINAAMLDVALVKCLVANELRSNQR